MKYISTRGQTAPMDFSDVLLMGLAPDGGLMLPEHYPNIDSATLTEWRALSYPQLAMAIMQRFATDIPAADLQDIIERTYTAEVFGSDEIVPVRKLEDDLYILGLSNGPTLAFKDVAMQFLGNMFEYVLNKKGERLTIIGATSGDTGSAAEYALRGKDNIEVFMMSPHGKMSEFQRAQMYSLTDKNIHNIAAHRDLAGAIHLGPAGVAGTKHSGQQVIPQRRPGSGLAAHQQTGPGPRGRLPAATARRAGR